jgi:uncharacterized protein (DUF58 family)
VSLVFRILYCLYCIFSWLRHWVRRRFTRSGLALLGALVVATVAGPDSENTVAYQAFIMLLALLLVAISFSFFFQARFSAGRLLPRFGTVGQPLDYLVVVKNLTPKTQSGLTLLEDPADPRPSFQDWQAVQLANQKQARSFRFGERRHTNPFRVAEAKDAAVAPVPPRHDAEVRVELTPLRRGVLRFAGVTLARPDPLGLFRAFARVPLPQTVLILPKRYPVPPMALPGTMKYQEGGVALAANVGQSDEFVALRDYRRGDPLRHIHWRSWAKTGKPVVKEFEDEFFVRHALVLDTFISHPHSELFEEAVSVAASFACTIPTQESLLDLLFVGPQAYCFTVGRGLAHADQMLAILASVRVCSNQPFRRLEHLVLNQAGVVSGCICVLLAWNKERRNFVEKLKTLGVPVLALVIVPPGRGRLLEVGPLRDEPDRFHVLEVGRIQEGLAKLK